MPLMISGARYSSVPTKELARPSGSATSVYADASQLACRSALLPCFCRRDAPHVRLCHVQMSRNKVSASEGSPK